MDVGEPKVPALVLVREALVVDSQQMQNGGVKVMHVDAVLGDVIAVFVCAAVRRSRF